MNSCWPGTESWRTYLYPVSLPLLCLSQLSVGVINKTWQRKQTTQIPTKQFNLEAFELPCCATEETKHWWIDRYCSRDFYTTTHMNTYFISPWSKMKIAQQIHLTCPNGHQVWSVEVNQVTGSGKLSAFTLCFGLGWRIFQGFRDFWVLRFTDSYLLLPFGAATVHNRLVQLWFSFQALVHAVIFLWLKKSQAGPADSFLIFVFVGEFLLNPTSCKHRKRLNYRNYVVWSWILCLLAKEFEVMWFLSCIWLDPSSRGHFAFPLIFHIDFVETVSQQMEIF